ncbi:MAG: hypothetical protein JW908_03670 [Anaerolineales bacterium]|nr:hypothetical protein [Anaerolineales bacterium]
MKKHQLMKIVIVMMISIFPLACSLFSSFTDQAGKANTDQNSVETEQVLITEVTQTETIIEESDDYVGIEYIYTDGLATALYHLYGNVLDHFVDVTLTNNGSEMVTLLVETEIEGYSTTASDTVDILPGEQEEIHQNPRLVPEAVDKLNSEQLGNFHIVITQLDSDRDRLLLEETKEILLYSRRDHVWIEGVDLHGQFDMYAAWVTPTDPAVEELIRTAADYTSSGMMTNGYGGVVNDEEGTVWDRLEALWTAEDKDYNLTYISTMVAFGPDTFQRMRMPYEVLEQRSGNCIELTTLFASATEALKLETAIVRIPGHAYVAIRTDQENANYYFIETTMIGRADFNEALDVGNVEWEETLPHLDAEEEGYAWINLAEAREKGILPMPWR